MYPNPQCCWLWLTNWKISGQYHLSPRLVTQSPGMDMVPKTETPKKVKPVDTGDTPRKHHKSHDENSQSKHSPTEKSPALSSHEHDVVPQASRLGDVVAQACLSVARMVRVVVKDPQLQDSRGPASEAMHLEKSLSQGY